MAFQVYNDDSPEQDCIETLGSNFEGFFWMRVFEVGTFAYPTLIPPWAEPLTLHMLQVDWFESLGVSGIPGVSRRNGGKQRRVAPARGAGSNRTTPVVTPRTR